MSLEYAIQTAAALEAAHSPAQAQAQFTRVHGLPLFTDTRGRHKLAWVYPAYVVKTSTPAQTRQARDLEGCLGRHFARVYHAGPAFIVQERVSPVELTAAARQILRALGVKDLRGNLGQRADGSLALYDGQLIPVRAPAPPPCVPARR